MRICFWKLNFDLSGKIEKKYSISVTLSNLYQGTGIQKYIRIVNKNVEVQVSYVCNYLYMGSLSNYYELQNLPTNLEIYI